MEISILVVTYNHQNYIEQCIKGIIMQKINVDYEVLILDDCSTDDTAKILKKYRNKIPNLRLFIRKKNDAQPTRNTYFLQSQAKGRYYAWCEGDDYWIDSNKIQKQYDFLEHNKGFSACVCGLKIVNERNEEVENYDPYLHKENKIFTLEDFAAFQMPGMACSFFARNTFKKKDYKIIKTASDWHGDITLYLLALLDGNIYQMHEHMTAYRYVCKKGESNYNSVSKDDIYRDYFLYCYLLKLKAYIRKYKDKTFSYDYERELYMYRDAIGNLPWKAALKIVAISGEPFKYGRWFVSEMIKTTKYIEKSLANKENTCQWGKFIKETQKKKVIIFGAGNVAKEYIDYEGWRHNIRFLVDNDVNKQNAFSMGYRVNKPEDILFWKDVSVVLIANYKHEEEIERQLQKMGITNYYSYCKMKNREIRNKIARRLERNLM